MIIVLTVVVMLFLGIGFTYFGMEDADYWRHAKSMPITNCTITGSYYDEDLIVHVSYSYQVNGTNYSSTQTVDYYSGKSIHRDSIAQRVVQNYYPGRNMTVRYETLEPWISHLKIHENNVSIITFSLGICLLAASPFVALIGAMDRISKWMNRDRPLKDR